MGELIYGDPEKPDPSDLEVYINDMGEVVVFGLPVQSEEPPEGERLELRSTEGIALIRDSKNLSTPPLALSTEAFRRLLEKIHSGELDLANLPHISQRGQLSGRTTDLHQQVSCNTDCTQQ